jgi:trk system potassium uptake protein|tara:strand:- start:5642 stop:7057 length:1416 start_codon:yes stop_codon:yes gene_type:complete
MNIKGIIYYLSLFCFPISVLAFLNILYSSYSDYFLNIESYTGSLFVSLILGIIFYFIGRNSTKQINFQEQLILIVLIYLTSSALISIPFYFSNYQITLINSLFESFSGLTGTGFTIFKNVKYLDPTLLIWRSLSQWLGGLYFLIFLILFFSNTKFQYKLNNLAYSSNKSLNLEINIKNILYKIFFLYLSLTILIFVLFSASNIRLFSSLNLSMTLISTGGFLSTNFLSQIIKTTTQELILALSFIFAILNIFLINNIFNRKKLKEHYEDFLIVILIIFFSMILFFSTKNINFLDILINVTSSLSNSGISTSKIPDNYSLYLIFLTIIGGSIISNTSGIKFLRFYILLKATYIEMLKIVKPYNIFNSNILFSENKITNENIKISFYIFISFFISVFTLCGILLLDDFNFENSFKLSILTLTNTAISISYGMNVVEFGNLLTSSKIFIIIFMIIGKIELLSIILIINKIFYKK